MKVPEYNGGSAAVDIGRPVAPYQSTRVTADSFGAPIGEALSRAGNQNMRTGDVLADRAIALQGLQNETLARDANTAAVRAAGEEWVKYGSLEGKNAVEKYPEYAAKIAGTFQATGDALPNDDSKRIFKDASARYLNSMIESGSVHAAKENRTWMLESHAARSSAAYDAAILHRDNPAMVDTWINTIGSEVRGADEIHGRDEETINQNIAEAKGKAYRGVIDALGNSSPNKAKEYYDSVKDRISGKYQAAIEDDLAKLSDQSLAVFRGDVERRYRDSYEALSDGKPASFRPSDLEIIAAFPKDRGKADALIRQLSYAGDVGSAKTRMALTTPEQDAEILSKYAPGGEDYAEKDRLYASVQQAYKAKQEALSKDPAGYVQSSSPKIAQLWEAARRDPKAMMSSYISAADAAQDQLGVPQWQRRYVPDAQAKNMVGQLLAMPPDARAAGFRDMATKYGESWPKVFGDLVHAKLPAAYEVAAVVDNPVMSTAMANSTAIGKKDLINSIPDADRKAVDDAFDDSDNMTSLLRSFSYAAGGVDKFSSIKDAVRNGAYYLVSQGMETKKAIETAVNSVTIDKYDFTGDFARVPKGMGPDAIAAGRHVIDSLQADNIAMPEGGAESQEARNKVFLENVRQGRWVTNANSTGLLRLDAMGAPVTLKNGKELEIPFDAINELATESRTKKLDTNARGRVKAAIGRMEP